jgi:hypothetical protein
VKSTPEVRYKFSLYSPKKLGKKDQFISIYFFGPLSSFPNITAKTIPRAEEKAKRNIKILSSPKVYHSMIIPSYDSLSGVSQYGFNVRELLKL